MRWASSEALSAEVRVKLRPTGAAAGNGEDVLTEALRWETPCHPGKLEKAGVATGNREGARCLWGGWGVGRRQVMLGS